jgi:tetratricopeptide (TPR) repeat protein
VEPSLLSLICRELNNARIAQKRSEISADLLAGSRDTILTEFYERALADQPPAVRRFIEDELLTESGFRESIAEERVRKAFVEMGARPDALATLVDRRLLRIEERLDVRRVELTHDVLCSVVRASRDVRHEREARDEIERKLAAQRASERATRKALVRARQVAAVCGVLAIGAIASAIFGYQSMKRAQQAEAQAQQTRTMAESARGEAEKLIVYLLDDFYLELEPVGRLDIVAQLSKRALDYYAALPVALRTPETERNRALALVRYGAVLRTQNQLDEGGKALAEAVDVLEKLRRGGDQSEATLIGLGVGLMSEGRVRDSLNERKQSQDLAAQAVAVLKPMMASSQPSIPLRRAYGAALNYLGYAQLSSDREELAVRTLEEARSVYRSIDGLKLDDAPAAAAFTEASAWQLAALQQLGMNDETRRVGAEAAKVADAVLERRPGHMGAIRARGLIFDSVAGAEMDDLHLQKAVTLLENSAHDWDAIVRIDPSNQIAWNNLSNARATMGYALYRMGRISDALEHYRAAVAIERRVKMSAFLARTFSFPAGGQRAPDGTRRPGSTARFIRAIHPPRIRATDLRIRDSACGRGFQGGAEHGASRHRANRTKKNGRRFAGAQPGEIASRDGCHSRRRLLSAERLCGSGARDQAGDRHAAARTHTHDAGPARCGR